INPSFADLTLLGMAFMEMPQQKHVCGQPGVLCGIAEVEERRSFGRTSWEQHMVVAAAFRMPAHLQVLSARSGNGFSGGRPHRSSQRAVQDVHADEEDASWRSN
ncbi:hypothetical protein PFISCL1PPCAC_28998, partial [Pristionchus fissidentatus]